MADHHDPRTGPTDPGARRNGFNHDHTEAWFDADPDPVTRPLPRVVPHRLLATVPDHRVDDVAGRDDGFDRFDDAGRDDPIDLVSVQADDELINALSAGMLVSAPGRGGYDADDQVAVILAAWKADVDREPIPELVDTDTAVATLATARRRHISPRARRVRHLVPVAAAVLAVALTAGGVSVGSASARPGDTLWAVSKVLYTERAVSIEAADRIQGRLSRAKDALLAGQPVLAQQELAGAQVDLAVVRPEEGGVELAEVQSFLAAKAAESAPGVPTDPGSPLASEPLRPVPPGATSEANPDPTEPAPEVGPTVPPVAPSGTTSIPPTGPADPSSSGSAVPGPESGGPGRPGTDPGDVGVQRQPVQPPAPTTVPTPSPSPGGEGGEGEDTAPTSGGGEGGADGEVPSGTASGPVGTVTVPVTG